MAEQTAASPAPQQHSNGANGAAIAKGKLTEAGRQKIAEAQKAHHAAHARNTSPITPARIKRLQALIQRGATVKEAAEVVGIGYSTAQRHLTLSNKKTPTKAKSVRSSRRAPLTTEQMSMLRRLIPKMPEISADEIARRAKVHFSTVYSYRRAMLGNRKPAEGSKAQALTTHGLASDIYADFREAYKLVWRDHQRTGEEPHNAELYFARAWRKLHGLI